MSVDEQAVDRLAALFAECRELGAVIPAALPLETPVQQRLAVAYLEGALYLAREAQRRKHG